MGLDFRAEPITKKSEKRPARVAKKRPAFVSADSHLRASKRNAALLSESIKAARRGELLAFDPRKK